ncbi:hypothetical protein KR059_005312, partial [Drosophila kikkawai]
QQDLPKQQPAEEEEEVEEALEAEDEAEPEDGDEEQEQEQEQEQSSSEEEKDPFELLDESEPDDEEEQAMYKEYLGVIKEIDDQNLAIQDLNAIATQLRCKRCKTYKDREEYKRLRICQEQQDIHLRQLINRAARLQNFGSRRLYGEVEMEVTDAEQSCFFAGLATTSLPACPLTEDEEDCCNKGCCW